MKVNYLTLLAGAAIMLLTVAATRADQSAVAALAGEANAAPAALTQSASTAAVAPVAADTATYYNDSDPVQDFIARAGAWGIHSSGSPAKVGEYQSLDSSPFWNADGIWSNGERAIDFSVQGDDNETRAGRLYYFGDRVEANVVYEGFLHQLDAKPYPGWTTIPATNSTNGANYNVFSRDDVNPGQNYAIRVQEYKANFKGYLTDNLKWHVNAFGIEKEGTRQANAITHCYSATPADVAQYPAPFNGFGSHAAPNNRQCHAVGQAQHIDWQTNEVDVGLELRMGCDTTLAYSHLIRAFEANDQRVINVYRNSADPTLPNSLGFPNATSNVFSTAGYGIVPDNQTQIDRLKFGTKIGSATDVYLLGYAGYNEDLLRDTYRNFNGTDLRITNKSLDKLTVTGFGKYYREDTTTALFPLTTAPVQPGEFYQEQTLGADSQINREVHAVGVNGRWTPFEDDWGTYRRGLAFVGGYEYATLMRENAGDALTALGTGPFIGPNPAPPPANFFTQPNSNKNTFIVGVEERWSSKFDTFLRYKFISTEYPLYGITSEAGSSIDGALNSSLPTQENRVELGCTWTPNDCLMVNATLYVENAMSDAPYVNWQSNSLPFTLSAFWSPRPDWSFSAGVAEMDSWINQDISMGPLNTTAAGVNIQPASFTGVSDVLNLGSRYGATEKLWFTGEFEYVHGINSSSIVVPSAQQIPNTGAAYDLGQYSLVKMQSFRFGVGADYLLRPRVTTYVRYNYYDYQDLSSGLTSGQASMILGGMSATF